jgi:hypothetical protein
MGFQESLAGIFRDWGKELNSQERNALQKKAAGYTMEDWRVEHLALVAGSGIAAGVTGGWWSLAAIGADLAWCRKVAPIACLGIGYIYGAQVDIDYDMNMIMAIWAGFGQVSFDVPVDKIAVQTSAKPLGKLAGKSVELSFKMFPKTSSKIAGKVAGKTLGKVTQKLITKSSLKSSPKMLAKLSAKIVEKAVAKVSAKAATKMGVGWIPIVGGVVSGGVNCWLLHGLMEAAEAYYSHPYVVFAEDPFL